ncbi:MAG: hypothetical protein HRT61_00700 [Ekhidna sp.]|nr:hypothetical protein [Ekhidna sp.]
MTNEYVEAPVLTHSKNYGSHNQESGVSFCKLNTRQRNAGFRVAKVRQLIKAGK